MFSLLGLVDERERESLATMAKVFSLMWIGTWEGGRLGNRNGFGFENQVLKPYIWKFVRLGGQTVVTLQSDLEIGTWSL